MADEISFPDEAHLGSAPVFSTSQDEQRPGLVSRVKALFPFFKRPESSHEKLQGRVHQNIQQNAHKIVEQLHLLRKEVKSKWHADTPLWTSFESVVRPLLREYEQLERKLQKSDLSPPVFVLVMQSYHDWLNKAKEWVALAERPHDREGISDTIIDRDLKMLQEYLVHELQALGIAPDAIERVERKIHQDIAVHLQGLDALKEHKAKDLDLAGLVEWKGRINSERATHYNEALHVIDTTIEEIKHT
jgi:hypothetical protein